MVALLVGLMLLVAPPSGRALQAAAAYGVLGLLGFLAQMVVAMEARLLPLATWCWAYAGSGYRVPPPTPHAMSDRVLQAMALAGWIIGVPSVAVGMALESALLVRLGAAALFNAVALTMFNHLQVLAHAHRASHASSWQS
jgi:hypothetical protein